MSEWRTVFWITFGVFNITNIIYLIWASGEVQAFNDPPGSKDDNQNKEPEKSRFKKFFRNKMNNFDKVY